MASNKPRIRAVLWDNDGVLVDTEKLYYEANRRILAGVGLTLDLETFADLSLGRGLSVLDVALDHGFAPERVEALRLERNALYGDLLRAGAEPMPGAARALRRLSGHVPMAVVTSSRRDHFDIIHARTGFAACFEFVLANGDYARHKPAPDPYLAAVRRLGLPPDQCLAVEDSPRGLASARAAGVPCAVVPNRLLSAADFSGAVAVLDSVDQVPDLAGAPPDPGRDQQPGQR